MRLIQAIGVGLGTWAVFLVVAILFNAWLGVCVAAADDFNKRFGWARPLVLIVMLLGLPAALVVANVWYFE